LEAYQGLRNMVLTLQPASVGIEPVAPLERVWGALTEIGFHNGCATIVSLADGTTSMYTSAGGGVIGAGQHERPAAASRQYLLQLQGQLDLFAPAEACTLPGDGAVAFVVLTYDGVRRAESTTARLADPAEPLHGLWIAANRVITEIRLMAPPTEPEASA
jgi:hypothetical protein